MSSNQDKWMRKSEYKVKDKLINLSFHETNENIENSEVFIFSPAILFSFNPIETP